MDCVVIRWMPNRPINSIRTRNQHFLTYDQNNSTCATAQIMLNRCRGTVRSIQNVYRIASKSNFTDTMSSNWCFFIFDVHIRFTSMRANSCSFRNLFHFNVLLFATVTPCLPSQSNHWFPRLFSRLEFEIVIPISIIRTNPNVIFTSKWTFLLHSVENYQLTTPLRMIQTLRYAVENLGTNIF